MSTSSNARPVEIPLQPAEIQAIQVLLNNQNYVGGYQGNQIFF